NKPMLHSTTHPTPVGALTLVASDRGLRAVVWPKASLRGAGVSGRPHRDPDHPILKTTARQLDEYFAGQRTTFDIPLDLEGTRFHTLVAVDAIDFDVQRGEAFGFLGPNGAGKTSTMRMIGCVSSPSGGELRVLGLDPLTDGPRIRARLGVVPQADTLDMELRVDENLLTHARYFDIPRNVARARTQELLEFVQLKDRARDEVEPLS